MSFKQAKAVTRRLGLSVSGGLGFTVRGGRLVDGSTAPDWIAKLNGCCVHEIAREAKRRGICFTANRVG